jgi:hypothetical protein
LTGGIRKGAKGEPPVAIFRALRLIIRPLRRASPLFPGIQRGRFSNFFLSMYGFFGIRHDPGGNLSVRLVIESCSASLFSRGSFRQQQAISFQSPDL